MATCLLAAGCATTQPRVEAGLDELVFKVEAQIQALDTAPSEGERAQASELAQVVRTQLADPETKGDPDRHVLTVSLAELEASLAGRSRPAVRSPAPSSLPGGFPEPPAPVASKPAIVMNEVSSAATSPSSTEDAAAELLLGASSPSSSAGLAATPYGDPREAFQSGPVQDHRHGAALMAQAKRTRSKAQQRELYAEARTVLSSCAEQGAELLRLHPKLKSKRFTAGSKVLRGDHVPKACAKKLRKVKKKLEASESFRSPRLAVAH